MLKEILKKMDNDIETGTRIGITTGPLYTLNIGRDDIEVSFIGDKINLAARLEHHCEPNCVLTSNAFFNSLKANNAQLRLDKHFKKRIIEPSDAKGQDTNITSWQIENEQLEDLLR